MPIFVIFIFYQIFQIIALPFLLFYLLLRKIKGKVVFGSFWQRVGLVPSIGLKKDQKVVWFHAVSVGEILSIQNLIKKIKNSNSSLAIYVTCGTDSGMAMAKKYLDADCISYLPFDFIGFIWLAFSRIKPDFFIVVEAEYWPSLLLVAKMKKVKNFLINARISPKSEKKYYDLRQFFLPLINVFDFVYTQSDADKQRFEKIGVNPNKLTVLGDIKSYNVFEKQRDFLLDTKNQIFSLKSQDKIVLLAGSIHPSEDLIYLEMFKKLKEQFANLQLILVPRHLIWQEKLIANVKMQNLKFKVWNEQTVFDENEILHSKDLDLIVVFRLGMLFKLYPLCDIFFLGGTFVPVGGHNLLESAAWGKLSIFGPNFQNCAETAKKLLSANAAFDVCDEKDLFVKVQNLLNDSAQIKTCGDKAKNWLADEAARVECGIKSLVEKFV
ncbi:TPA: hypothetical protein DEO28_02035 [Candidatus Dependentiae bacterium]|nr:MAG: Three-deoxy-D-manno-octulosonic-acid transferase domain-containing protein [candidate division TM6 bacterium GW2011_GWE2_31_21]KKP53009.1 MAG: Three-deoxy-D-manno-octulosonic-acid transferase domain-containing protein [candidate division TM6 bacterium GW2011_GWF2_33_332]HBS47754.1 hypothetical protein [Candidatus Dependentiae bacterium]HBZ73270.1 hypothetical protein [Candidatus Dependentiae bacterium]